MPLDAPRPALTSLAGLVAKSFRGGASPAGPGPARRICLVLLLLVGANLAAWGGALVVFGTRPALLGAALLAWGFGLRHAVDADHIAAIDNATRRLMQRGQRPVGVGLFFSLGHSAVVVAASLAIVLAQGWFRSRQGLLSGWGGVAGTLVSAGFLLLIGGSNLAVLVSLLRLRLRLRRRGVAALPETLPAPRGVLSRLLRPLLARVGSSRGMFWIGLLFGLGFDTATEIGVLGLAAAGATGGHAGWSVMVFPALFTAGMALVDTADGVLMLGAYGWALSEPAAKLGYNLAITAGSVLVALAIGLLEVLDLAGPRWALPGWIAVLDSHAELIGYAVVGGFALLWVGALGGWLIAGRARPRAG